MFIRNSKIIHKNSLPVSLSSYTHKYLSDTDENFLHKYNILTSDAIHVGRHFRKTQKLSFIYETQPHI